jgi:ElaB protein
MESTVDDGQVRNAKLSVNGEINTFIENVEDLTNALRDVETPEIARVKAKVRIALAAAKSALSDSAAQVRSQARLVSKNTDTYVRDNPWQVVGIAAVIGLVVGILASRRPD